MTTTTLPHSAARSVPVDSIKEGWVGRAPCALSIALALATLAAAGGAVFFSDMIRGAPAVTVGNMQGTAAVLGFVTIPVLLVSMVLLARGIATAIVFWLGALGSIAYQSVLFLFGVPFNSFFFLDVAMLGLSVWALAVLAGRIPIDEVARRVGTHAPRRIVAAYLLINAGLFLALWLGSTVPPVLSGKPAAFLEGTGMTTGPVQIIDLAFTLPLMAVAAILLLRGRPWGYLLSGSLLLMLAIETTSIGVDQWVGHAADPSSPAASAAMTPVFAVMTVIGVAVLALFLRPDPSKGGHAGSFSDRSVARALAGSRDVDSTRWEVRQHSIARSVILHLLPGALITIFYAAVAPVVRDLGFPNLMALYLAIVVVLIPFELGYLFYRARTDGVSLAALVPYREPVPRGQLVGLVAVTLIWASLIAMLLFPNLDTFFSDTFFFWVPDSFSMAEDFARYSTTALLVTLVFGFVVNGFAGPITEELYFRGYLLPRIARFGRWAPVLNTVLFSLYHFFTPWANVGRIVALLPMVSATWWKRNIYLGMAVHVLWNVGGMLLLLSAMPLGS